MRHRSFTLATLLTLIGLLLAACGGSTTTTSPSGAASTAASAAASTAASAESSVAASPEASASTAASASAEASTSASTEASAEASTEASSAAEASAEATGTAGGAGPGPSTGRPSVDPATIGPELASAYNGDYKGTTVTMLGPFVDADAEAFNESMRPFEELTGIDVQYEGTKEFESLINVRVEGGTPPDIADTPQPGLVESLAKAGNVQDLSKWINQDWLKQNYAQGYIDALTMDDKDGNEILGGIFQRINVKSLVWYPKDDWDEAGYKIPETWDEMISLMDEIVADGDTPWCIGIESGVATGWPATDWIEEIMLRTTSQENYDKWTSGELPFTSPEVKAAAERMQQIWFNDKYVYGGRQQIVSTNFGDSVAPMFEEPPRCWLHKQGNFITNYFPDDAEAGVDYDFFYLPPIDPQYGKPVLFAGDPMIAFADRPEVRAVMQYFTTFDSLKGWVATGGALSPHNDADISAYGSDIERKLAEILANADRTGFDGSDLMPGAVGAGTFWQGMTNWVSGNADLDQALETAQQGWNNVQR